MCERDVSPEPNPFVKRLTRSGSENETEDVVALVGYVGAGQDGRTRLYADPQFQRWLDISAGDIVDSASIGDTDDLGGRTVVWVRHEAMVAPVFSDTVLTALDGQFKDGGMSTWTLIPDSRYVAAELLGLLVDAPGGARYEGRAA